MADNARKRTPFFTTPLGTVTLSVMCWVLACVLALVAILVLQIIELREGDRPTAILATYLAFAPSTVAVIFSIVFLIVGSVRWAVFGRSSRPSVTLDLKRELALLESINQRLLLSETAKKISYRTDDMAVLRKTLEEDIQKGEFNAAMVLVAELANAYGQLEEAEDFRSRIEEARRQDQEAKVAAGVQKIEQLLGDHDFAAANREADRLQRLYPSVEKVEELPGRVETARELYKKELERAFLHASERDEIDRALEIMKKLDTLLTHDEAEPFREVARGVIGKKRDNLGVQFKLAVHDKEWTQAVAAGEQIIKQFPNSRMADEVRTNIDQLRANAGGQQNAAAPPPAASRPAPPHTGISYTTTD
jgi:tetratricopeptide (TPR) repeat protein